MNQGSNLQNCIILLSLYQRSITISGTITNPPAAVIVDRARGGRGRGRSNYHNRRRGYSRFRNRIYNNNRGGLYKYKNSRKNNKRDYSRDS
jgi:hypothetical protein